MHTEEDAVRQVNELAQFYAYILGLLRDCAPPHLDQRADGFYDAVLSLFGLLPLGLIVDEVSGLAHVRLA